MNELTKESFDSLPEKEQRRLAEKALAWFCVMESMFPYFGDLHKNETATIKIILGKFMNGKMIMFHEPTDNNDDSELPWG